MRCSEPLRTSRPMLPTAFAPSPPSPAHRPRRAPRSLSLGSLGAMRRVSIELSKQTNMTKKAAALILITLLVAPFSGCSKPPDPNRLPDGRYIWSDGIHVIHLHLGKPSESDSIWISELIDGRWRQVSNLHYMGGSSKKPRGSTYEISKRFFEMRSGTLVEVDRFGGNVIHYYYGLDN